MKSRLLVVLLFLAWMLPGLVGHEPWKPDEAYSFGLVLSAIKEPQVVPMLAGEPFVEKPPLYYFTAAGLARVLSPPLALHDAARLATALWMGIAVLFLWLTVRAVFTEGTAHMSVVLLLGSLGLLIRSHQLITDTALLAGFGVALYGLARSAGRSVAGGVWLGTGVGIAFMAKGLLGPGIIGITAAALPLVARTTRTRKYLAALGVALLAAAPWLLAWPLALYDASPALFREWFWDNNFGRFLGTSHLGPRASHGHYLKILPWYTLPVLPLAVWALWRRRGGAQADDNVRLLVLLFGVTLLVLWSSADARELYAMPLLLPLAALAAPAALALPARVESFWYRLSVGGFALAAALAWLAWIALEFAVPSVIQQKLLQVAPAYTPGLRWIPVAVAALMTIAWLVVVWRLRRCSSSAAIAWTSGVTLVWVLAMTLHLGWIDASKSYRPVAEALQRALPQSYRCVSSRGLGEPQRAVLDYYANLRTYREESAARRNDCDLLLVQHSADEPLPANAGVLWQGARAGDANERLALLRVR